MMQKTTFQPLICHLLHLKRWQITTLNGAYWKANYIVFIPQAITDVNKETASTRLFI